MASQQDFKQRLSVISRLWTRENYDSALTELNRMIAEWPGNGHLQILWASLVQLQENPIHNLDEARRALQRAVELDVSSPAGLMELGHFLDAVDDDPRAASKAFSEGTARAREQLIEGLIGQAAALNELEKHDDALRCLLEAISVMHFQSAPKRRKPKTAAFDPAFKVSRVQLEGRFSDRIEELLSEVVASRSA